MRSKLGFRGTLEMVSNLGILIESSHLPAIILIHQGTKNSASSCKIANSTWHWDFKQTDTSVITSAAQCTLSMVLYRSVFTDTCTASGYSYFAYTLPARGADWKKGLGDWIPVRTDNTGLDSPTAQWRVRKFFNYYFNLKRTQLTEKCTHN